MAPGSAPTDPEIEAATNADLLALYSVVIGELSTRHVEEHPDHGGPPEAPPAPLAALDRKELSRIYTTVHTEMMRRHQETPGIWEPPED